MNIPLVVGMMGDFVSWHLKKSGVFSVRSAYYKQWEETYVSKDSNPNGISGSAQHPGWKKLWSLKIPSKIKIFLCQLSQDCLLTRQVMKLRRLPRDPKCSFRDNIESSRHLFFTCPVARVVWRTVGCVLGTDTCPNNIWQYFSWCHCYLPDRDRFYTFGLAALCWAMWNCRNKKIFELKELRSPFDVVCSACGYISYWACLLSAEDREAMERGA